MDVLKTTQLMDLYRLEARRQAVVCKEIVDQVLKTDGLFSDDVSHAGITRQSLNDLRKTIEAELAKLDANEASIAIIGTVKSGKSTSINAVVGFEVVPSRDAPMTTFPTRIIHRTGISEPILHFPARLAGHFKDLIGSVRERLNELRSKGPESLHELIGKSTQKDAFAKLIGQIEDHSLETIPVTAAGADVTEVLIQVNDITRLAHTLGVSLDSITPEAMSYGDIPSIEIEFEHLMGKDAVFSGSLALIDTPGPDEAGQSERLTKLVERQLADATAIILVIKHAQLGTIATDEVRKLLSILPDGAIDRLFVFVNQYDNRTRSGFRLSPEQYKEEERRRRDELRKVVAQQLLEQSPSRVDEFATHVFPTAARHALRANQARRALRQDEPITSTAWVMDFAYIAGLEDDMSRLADPEEIRKKIDYLWNLSLFKEPLQRVIAESAKNATRLLVASCLDKLASNGKPIFEMLEIRESTFLRSIEDLQELMDGLQADLDLLRDTSECNRQLIEKVPETIEVGADKHLAAVVDDTRNLVSSYLRTGDPEGTKKRSSNAIKETSARRYNILSGIPSAIKSIGAKAKEFVSGEGSTFSGSDAPKHASLLANAPKFETVYQDEWAERRIKVASADEAKRLSEAIFDQIQSIFAAASEDIAGFIDEAVGIAVSHLKENISEQYKNNWRHVQEKMKSALDVDIGFPELDLRLEVGLDIRMRGGNTIVDHKSKTEKLKKKGAAIERAAGAIAGFFGHEKDWGYVLVTTEYNEHYISIKNVEVEAFQKIGEMRALTREITRNSIGRLQKELDKYDLRQKNGIESINLYLLQEMEVRSSDTESNMKRRMKVSELATQARDLVGDAMALKFALRETGA